MSDTKYLINPICNFKPLFDFNINKKLQDYLSSEYDKRTVTMK